MHEDAVKCETERGRGGVYMCVEVHTPVRACSEDRKGHRCLLSLPSSLGKALSLNPTHFLSSGYRYMGS